MSKQSIWVLVIFVCVTAINVGRNGWGSLIENHDTGQAMVAGWVLCMLFNHIR